MKFISFWAWLRVANFSNASMKDDTKSRGLGSPLKRVLVSSSVILMPKLDFPSHSMVLFRYPWIFYLPRRLIQNQEWRFFKRVCGGLYKGCHTNQVCQSVSRSWYTFSGKVCLTPPMQVVKCLFSFINKLVTPWSTLRFEKNIDSGDIAVVNVVTWKSNSVEMFGNSSPWKLTNHCSIHNVCGTRRCLLEPSLPWLYYHSCKHLEKQLDEVFNFF